MSGELATINQVITQVDPTGGRLVSWAHAADAANQLARALCTTTFVPVSMKDVGNATAAILMGDELGFTPLAALKSIYVVHGTPALYTRAMVALIQSRGHEIWTEESKNDSVTVKGRRKDSDHIESSTWTIKRAQDAKYTSNAKYQTNPQEMLYSKAAAEIARKIGADVLLGIPYSVEDLELEEVTTTTLQRDPESAPIKIKRAQKEKVEIPAPDLDSEDEVVVVKVEEVTEVGEVPAPDLETDDDDNDLKPRPITEAQIKKMGAQMRELGMTDRDVALPYVSDVIGRAVASRNELTLPEASKVIESLDADIRVHNAEQESRSE